MWGKSPSLNNINTLTKKDNLLLSSIYPNVDIADAEYIIDNIPMEGFENNDNLQKAFPEFDFSLSYGNIAFTSKIFKLEEKEYIKEGPQNLVKLLNELDREI